MKQSTHCFKHKLAFLLALLMVLATWPANAVTVRANTVPQNGPRVFINGLVPEQYELSYPTPRARVALPVAYDARATNSPVKNQGINGLCWIFATYAAAEASLLKSSQGAQDLSELHMAHATSASSENTDQGFSRTPDGGGNRYYAASYLMRGTSLSGTVAEAQDPYAPFINAQVLPRDLSTSQSKLQNFTVQNIVFISGSGKADTSTVGQIKDAVFKYNAVGASMYWYGGTATAEAGTGDTLYYNAANATYFYDEATTIIQNGQPVLDANHAVAIVGWDDNFDRTKFNSDKRPLNNGAWLIKNSWSDDWGDEGYFWISYEDTNFPQHAYAIDGIVPYSTDKTVYEHEYRWEGAGASAWQNMDTSYARVFTVQNANEQLKQVKVSFTGANASVSVDVIPNFTDFASYGFTPNTTKTFTYPGFYTIDLNSPVMLGAVGSKFAVVVRVSNGTSLGHDNYSSAPTGTAYWFNVNSNTWDENTANYNIKAVTEPAPSGIDIVAPAAITVTAPVTGATPNTATVGGIVAAAPYAIGQVTWAPAHNPFQGGTQYTAYVTLTANSGYVFPGNFSASINGQPANVTGLPGTTATLSYTFSATAVLNSTLDPVVATYDKNNGTAPATTLTLNGNSLVSITNGAYALVLGTDYTVSGQTYTIAKSYLDTLVEGDAVLSFNMSAGTNPVFTVTVSDTTPGNSTVNPTTAQYDKNGGTAPSTTLALNGNSLVSINNREYALVLDEDYTVSGQTYTIAKPYLDTLENGTWQFTFHMNAGANPVFTVTVSDSTPVNLKTVSVGTQNGTLTAGTPGLVTFVVTTNNIASGAAIAFNNIDAVPGLSLETMETGNDDAAEIRTTVEISTTAASPQGRHRLSLTIDGITSNIFTLSINQRSDVQTFSVTVSNSYAWRTGTGSYVPGQTVTIDAGSRSGYRFSGWTTNGITLANASIAVTTFIMPRNNVVVTANWTSDGSGGGSSGGSSSGTSSSPTPTPAPNNTLSLNGTSVSFVLRNNTTAVLNLPNWKIRELIGQLKGGPAVFDFSDVRGARSAIFTVNAARLFSRADVAVKIQLPGAVIILSPDALALLAPANRMGSTSVTIETATVAVKTLTKEQAARVNAGDTVVSLTVLVGRNKMNVPLTVSLPHTLARGKNPKAVSVWHMDEDGVLTKVGGGYDAETGMVTFDVDHQSYFVIKYDPAAEWLDVLEDADAWHSDVAAYINQFGLFEGGESEFAAKDSMTGALFATVLWHLSGSPTPEEGSASVADVAPWYHDAVVWATENGIINAEDNTDGPISQREMADMLLNYANYKGYEIPEELALD